MKQADPSRRWKTIYPWIAITVSALFLVYKYILQVSPSVMTNELMQAFHVHATGLGNLSATFFYSYLITQFFVGILLDKYSARYLSAIAILVAAFGAYFFSSADQLWSAEACRLMMGVGAAFATVSYMKVAAMWFRPKQFAFVGGLLATAAMLGAIFGEAPLSLIVDSAGWRESMHMSAILGFVIAGLFIIVIRDRHTTHAFDQRHPPKAIRFKDVLSVMKKPQNWVLTFYSGLAFSPVAVFGGLWGNPFLEEMHHLTRTQSAYMISLIFWGLLFGGPILGLVSGFIGRRKPVMLWCAVIGFFCLTSVIYLPSLPIWVDCILLFIFGFCTGAFMLGFAVGREINPIAMAATVIALVNTGDAIFGGFTEPLVGKLLDMQWHGVMRHGVPYFDVTAYHNAFLLLPIYLAIAAGLVFFVKETYCESLSEKSH